MDSNNSHSIDVISKLIETAADKDDGVRKAICSSLQKLSKKYPNDVLQCSMNYKQKHPKMSNAHLLTLLSVMEQICQEQLNSVSIEVIHQIVFFTVEEMTRTSDYLPDSQLRASGILVAIGYKYCIEVMDGLVLKLQPGVLPHWAVLHTLADLAAANPFGLVPFVKATMGTLLPMLGAARSDAMRQVFAFAFGRLSEAVLEYLAGLSSAPDPTVRAEAFASEVGTAYDVFATSWLGAKDTRVLSPVLAALGPMLALQGAVRIREQVPRLLPTLLVLYKRGCDPLPVTQCLAAMLQNAFEAAPEAIEQLLDLLIPALFDQICPLPDYAQPQTVKNHFEALRCFDHIARTHPSRLAEAIVQLLRNNNERERTRAMLVTAHLVGSSERLMGSHTIDLVAGLHALPPETGSKAKKALLKAVVALAYRGHLVGAAGVHFIHFLVHSCCQSSDNTDSEEVDEFARTCASTLFLLASTVPAVEQILWPLLLQCLLQPKYSAAASDLGRCLAHLATHRADAGPNKLPTHAGKTRPGEDVADAETVPSPESVLARCLALLGDPLLRGRGQALLAFLQRYAASVNRLLPPLWEQRIPELIHHLENLESDDDPEHRDHVWEDLLLEFVAATLAEIDQSVWALNLGNTLLAQLNNTPSQLTAERASLSKCLALAASHASDAGLLKKSLETLLGGTRPRTPEESEAVGRAIGLLSRRNLAPVLEHLGVLRKEEATLRRSSSRLLGIGWRGTGNGEIGADRACLTLAACYGQLAVEAPADDLLPALEAGPVSWLLKTLTTSKDAAVKKAVLHALGRVAEGLHPNRNSSPIGLTARADVLTQVLTQLKSQDLEVMALSLQVTTSFLKIPPILSTKDRIAVLGVTFEEVFSTILLVSEYTSEKGEVVGDHATSSLLAALGTLTQALLLASTTPAVLDDVFSLLEPWLVVRYACQRAAALFIVNGALQCYVANMKFGCEAPSRFGQTGLMLGRVVPRCTDPSLKVRRLAVGTVRLILSLAARYEGRLGADNDLVNVLLDVQNSIQTNEPSQLFQATTDLAQALSQTLPPLQLVPFVDSLLDGLKDTTDSGAAGTSVVLTTVIKAKGGELYHQVSPILNTIVRHAGVTACPQTQTGAVRAVLALAKHHPKAVVGALLLQPLPYDQAVQECWRIIARDNTLAPDVMDQLLRLLQGPLYEERAGHGPPIAVLMPLAAVAALRPLLLEQALQQFTSQHFPELFSALLTAVASYIGVAPPVNIPNSTGFESYGVVPNRNAYRLIPDWIVRESLKALLLSAHYDEVAETLVNGCHPEAPGSLETFTDVVPHIAKSLCTVAPSLIPKVVNSLNHYISSNFEPQRVAVASFFAELVRVQAGGQLLLLEGVLSSLLSCLGDPSPLVRRLCLRGIGATASLPFDQRVRHAEQVLAALVRGLDEPDPLEAMYGLTAVLPVTKDPTLLRGVTVAVALRVRPLFERENPVERAAALRLFGELAQAGAPSVGDKEGSTSVVEQVHGALVPLLLHLHDIDLNVIRASKFALRQASPLLGAPHTDNMVQGHLIDAGNLHYEEFVTDLTRTVARELPDQVPQFVSCALSFTRGGSPSLRGDAAMIAGLLCGSLICNSEGSVDAARTRLLQLLSDESSFVRVKAAESLSYLFLS